MRVYLFIGLLVFGAISTRAETRPEASCFRSLQTISLFLKTKDEKRNESLRLLAYYRAYRKNEVQKIKELETETESRIVFLIPATEVNVCHNVVDGLTKRLISAKGRFESTFFYEINPRLMPAAIAAIDQANEPLSSKPLINPDVVSRMNMICKTPGGTKFEGLKKCISQILGKDATNRCVVFDPKASSKQAVVFDGILAGIDLTTNEAQNLQQTLRSFDINSECLKIQGALQNLCRCELESIPKVQGILVPQSGTSDQSK